MAPKNISELSEQELSQKLKTIKNNKIIDAVLVGITVGISFYSAVNNGFSFFTFFPLLLAYMFVKNSENNKLLQKEIEKELHSRNLK